MLKIDFQDGGCGGHRGFSIGSFSYFVSTKHHNAHHQVSIQLDYRRYVQNMNSHHFSPYKCIGPKTKAKGSKFDIAVKRSNVNVEPSF